MRLRERPAMDGHRFAAVLAGELAGMEAAPERDVPEDGPPGARADGGTGRIPVLGLLQFRYGDPAATRGVRRSGADRSALFRGETRNQKAETRRRAEGSQVSGV